jgi:hypothetical protein
MNTHWFTRNAATTRESCRHFVGGSHARIIIAGNEAALIELWKEKRGDAEPGELSNNLIVHPARHHAKRARALLLASVNPKRKRDSGSICLGSGKFDAN